MFSWFSSTSPKLNRTPAFETVNNRSECIEESIQKFTVDKITLTLYPDISQENLRKEKEWTSIFKNTGC